MSALALISSALPPKADVAEDSPQSPLMTHSGSQSLHDRLPHSSTYDDDIIVWASTRLTVFSHSWTHYGLDGFAPGKYRATQSRR